MTPIAHDEQTPAERWIEIYGDKLPQASPSISALIGGARKSEDELVTLERIASANPGSIVRLLKVANSPFFGLSKQIISVKQALTVLGLSAAQAIILRGYILDTFNVAEEDLLANDLITHSVMTGVSAKILAEELGIPKDIAFTSGVLHNVGKLTMLVYARTVAEEIYHGNDRSGEELERELEVFGFSHAELGVLMLKRWNIPDTIVETIRDYQSIELCTTPLKKVVHSAHHLAHLLHQSLSDQQHIYHIEGVTSRLGINKIRLDCLRQKIAREVSIIMAPI